MTDVTMEPNPVDLGGQAERAEKQRQYELARDFERRRHLAWSLSGPHGRRELRGALKEAGFSISSDTVRTHFDRHYGQMCFDEGLRTRAMQKIWPLLRGVSNGDIPLANLKLLMTDEGDTRE